VIQQTPNLRVNGRQHFALVISGGLNEPTELLLGEESVFY